MRGVSFAALLGLSDFRKDAFATGIHAYYLQRKYPAAEIAFSCPRLRPILNGKEKYNTQKVTEKDLMQVILAYRLFMPFAGITVSTRERANFRDNVAGLVATKLSAGVKTDIGAHTGKKAGDEQFVIADVRTLDEIKLTLEARNLQVVTNDYVYCG